MPRTIPLRVPLDDSGLDQPMLATTPPPRRPVDDVGPDPQSPASLLGTRTVTVSGDDVKEIFARLAPYVSPHLQKVEPSPSGYGLRFTFAPFTGRELRPCVPATYYHDPRLKYVDPDDDPAEHRLRRLADDILTEVLEAAVEEWKDAAYVAALTDAIGDAPDRWRAYERERKGLDAAYDYLRTPHSAAEWPAAVSRLVDAQTWTAAAAQRFDERAAAIAQVRQDHMHSELSRAEALDRAGHPEAVDWHIAYADTYGRARCQLRGWTDVPLAEVVHRLTEEQDAHVAKVARLSGLVN